MNKLLKPSTLSMLHKAINDEKYLLNSKVMLSSLIYSPTGSPSEAKIVAKNIHTPPFLNDYIVYLILRSICKTWIVTGQGLRCENELKVYNNVDFHGYNDIEKLFYLNEDCNKHEKPTEYLKLRAENRKNVFVLSNNISEEDLLQLKFFRDDFANKFVSNYSFDAEGHRLFLQKHNITLLPNRTKTFSECLNYCVKYIPDSRPLLCELGPKALKSALDEQSQKFDKTSNFECPNSIDLILLSIYTGHLDSVSIGPDFPDINQYREYKLVNTSDSIPTEKGYLKFLTYIKH